MANTSFASQAFKPAVVTRGNIFAEIFAATPLYIFITALKQALQHPRQP